MNLTDIAKRFEKVVVDNSPSLLTAIGVTGTVTTAVLTGKASFKAARIIENELDRIYRLEPDQRNAENDLVSLTLRERAEMTWKLYIPAASTGAVTIAAVIGANRIGNRRAAAVAAAYSLTEKAFADYKDKVTEMLGEKKSQQVSDNIAQDRVDQNPVSQREVIISGGEVLCYEAFTGRYFMSSMETLKKAQNDLNYKVLNDTYASLGDFYDLVDLPKTSYSDEVGWNCDKMLELEFSTTLSDDGRPCICVNFMVAPVREYYRLH